MNLFLNVVKTIVNVEEFVHVLGGAASFFDSKIRGSWREAQNRVGVPTLGIAGVTDEFTTPEVQSIKSYIFNHIFMFLYNLKVLTWMSNSLTKQMAASVKEHDTQVCTVDSVGHCNRMIFIQLVMILVVRLVSFTD